MKRIIVVGGGAGGLELVTKLGHKLGRRGLAEIILVDRSRTHIWKPLLHEVATGSLDINTDGINYRAHSARHYYQYQLGTMIGMNAEEKSIELEALVDEENHQILPIRSLSYDILVLAVGSVSNDFGTPGVKENCYFLDSHKQAERFQQALLNQFLRVHQTSDNDAKLKLAIVGAGATGVELAAELNHVADLLKAYGMRNMSSRRMEVSLIEAGDRILPALPERIATLARKELSRLGVQVNENTRIVKSTETGFLTAEDKMLEADLTVRAAGVKAPDFIKEIKGLELNRANQILVDSHLQAKSMDSIYVIGDCCAYEQEDGRFVPPRAQSAHQMASLVYSNIVASFTDKPLKEFVYHDHGSLVNLSRYSTVGSLMGNLSNKSMFIEGRIARFVYVSLYRMHQIAIHGWVKAVLIMIVKKISKAVKPKMKLH